MEINKFTSHHTDKSQLIASDNTYIIAATSPNTRKAYQNDIKHFVEQGGVLPATPEIIEIYLKKCAEQYNPNTLIRRLTSLRQWHKLKELPDPTANALVIKTMRGISRLHGRPKQQAVALRLKDLDELIQYLDTQTSLISIRNKALLLLGFFGAFRRSELVSLQWSQIEFVSEGMIVTLPRSKTDQAGQGQTCIIPFGNQKRCPVQGLIAWRQASKVSSGFIFRRISKTERVLGSAITAKYFNVLIKNLAKAVNFPNAAGYSSHSLRRGFATEAARLGASMPAIQRHGRWRTTKTVVEYIEAGRQFSDSAVKKLYEF